MRNKKLRLSEEDEEYIKEYHYVEWNRTTKKYLCSADCGYGNQSFIKDYVMNHIESNEHRDKSTYKTFFNRFNSKYFLNSEYSMYSCKECDETYNFNLNNGLEHNLKTIQEHFDTHR